MSAEGAGIQVDEHLTIPRDEIRLRAVRSGGPGGQNVNKVASKVVLRFSVARSASLGEERRERLLRRLAPRLTKEGALVLHADRHRERRRNEEDALARLAEILRKALAQPRKRKPTRPTRASRERRMADKRRKAGRKEGRRPAREGGEEA